MPFAYRPYRTGNGGGVKTLSLLLDQMIDQYVSAELKKAGHDVVRVREVGLATADDYEILEKAIADNRILITLDEHFGDWTVLPLKKHPGVIRIKANPTTSMNVLDVLLPFIENNSNRDFRSKLVIISKKGNRWIRT